jgi:hypothetical protein
VDGLFRRWKIELHELTPDFFHRDPLSFVRLRVTLVCGLVQTRPRAPSELLGSERGDIDEQKPVRHGRSRLSRV